MCLLRCQWQSHQCTHITAGDAVSLDASRPADPHNLMVGETVEITMTFEDQFNNILICGKALERISPSIFFVSDLFTRRFDAKCDAGT